VCSSDLKQALLAISYESLLIKGGCRLTKDIIEKRDSIFKELKKLNKKGRENV
jgi:hypothetical protein